MEQREVHVAAVPRAPKLASPGAICRSPGGAIARLERAERRPDNPVRWITALRPDALGRTAEDDRFVKGCTHVYVLRERRLTGTQQVPACQLEHMFDPYVISVPAPGLVARTVAG